MNRYFGLPSPTRLKRGRKKLSRLLIPAAYLDIVEIGNASRSKEASEKRRLRWLPDEKRVALTKIDTRWRGYLSGKIFKSNIWRKKEFGFDNAIGDKVYENPRHRHLSPTRFDTKLRDCNLSWRIPDPTTPWEEIKRPIRRRDDWNFNATDAAIISISSRG